MKRGKKPGSPKTGGRKKGSRNKVNRAEELRKAAAAGGQTPLEFMLDVMRDDEATMEFRCDMAKAAAPYLHARRAPEDKQGNTVPPMIYTHPDLEEPE